MVDFLWMPKSGTMQWHRLLRGCRRRWAGHTASHFDQRNVQILHIGWEAEVCALNQCFAFARKNKYIWIHRFPAIQTSYDDDPLLLTICILEFWMVEKLIHSADSGGRPSSAFQVLSWGESTKSQNCSVLCPQKSEWRWEFIVWRVMLWVEWIPVQHIYMLYIHCVSNNALKCCIHV